MLKFVSLFALFLALTSAADEEPSLRGGARDLRDYQIGDFASVRPVSVPGNYYADGTSTGALVPFNEVATNGKPASAFPLQLCQGDCNTDSDCASGLVCRQRNGNETVPGCTGPNRPGVDFCYKPNGVVIPVSNTGPFRLKLYWQKGYYWQEETFERKWCMVCHTMALGGKGCEAGDDFHLETCATSNTYFDFIYAANGAVQIQVAGSDLCMGLKNAAASTFQTVTLRICDAKTPTQDFTAGLGNFFGFKFELSPISGGCLSNTHHPKQGEYIYNQNCERPRAATASYWNKY
jgi:hypothetical protein